ncbi:hypothetical protein LCGC14_2935910, partial [marine sediment metagenome]
MLVATDLGVTPPALRPRPTQPAIMKVPAPLLDGPRILVGPFNFPAKGKGSKVMLAASLLSGGSARSKGRDTFRWIFARLVDQMTATKSFEILGCQQRFWFDGKTKNIYYPCAKATEFDWFTLPTDRRDYSLLFFSGKHPLVRTYNKETKSDWGLFAKWTDEGITIEFKPIEKGFWAKLWDAIVSVISTIV